MESANQKNWGLLCFEDCLTLMMTYQRRLILFYALRRCCIGTAWGQALERQELSRTSLSVHVLVINEVEAVTIE